jgi:perosamine synthetase
MIPVFEPNLGEAEVESVIAAVRAGEISGSFGGFIPRFEQEFADYCGSKYGIAVSSGTTALHLAVAAAEIGPGDEVLVSASTNIATALAVHHNGATVVPVDSEPDTWNLDLDLIESLITPRTKAIIPVHLFGHPVDMDRLNEIANKHNLVVIEDAAEAHGATVRGRMTGSLGHMACFSFYANKLITTGEGGMVTTNDETFAEKIRSLRNLAFRKPRFWHSEAGYNFRMTGMQAALGVAQLARLESFISQKRSLARMYNQRLRFVPGLQLPTEATWARNVYWMYSVTVDPALGISRDQLAAQLLEFGIDTRTFFCPMNLQPCLRAPKLGGMPECPVAEKLWQDGLYLPSTTNLSESQIEFICGRIESALQSRRGVAA